MIVTVKTVHPSVTVVEADGREFELPTASFTIAPKVGQAWKLELVHQPTSQERIAELNDYLNPAEGEKA